MGIQGKALELAAAELDEARIGKREVLGRLRSVSVRFEAWASGWRVDAAIQPGPYALDICRRSLSARVFGDVEEMHHGDPGFDKSLQLSGAPTEFIRHVLDPRLVRRLTFLRPQHLRVANGTVSLTQSYPYSYAEAEDIAAALDAVVSVAERVSGYVAEVHQQTLQESCTTETPYRGAPQKQLATRALARLQQPVTSYLSRQQAFELRRRKVARTAVGLLVAWSSLILLANVLTYLG